MNDSNKSQARALGLPALSSLALAVFAANALGHGLMVDPPARNAVCGLNEKPDQASTQACVDAFANDPQGGYSFMSVLTHDVGRAGVTPLPNNVCGFDSETWQGGVTPWDVATDWPTQPAAAGLVDITWNISWGPHFDDTEEFRYWITKPDFVFDPAKPLSWSDFEDTAFCVLNYDDKNPSANPAVIADKAAQTFKTQCELPARAGHHVVYGEWGRNYFTFERFHGCIDMAFGSGPTPPVANAQSLTTNANQTLAITLSGQDADGQVVDFNVVTSPTSGSLTGTGASRVYSPAVDFAGTDSFQFVAIDNDGQSSAPATVAITVKGENQPPVAVIGADISGLSVMFHAHDSTDPDNDPLTFTWDLGDGNLATGPHVNHTYATAGSYDVLLTASDGIASASATQTVSVSATPPANGVSCEHVINNEWNTGFVASVRLTNHGTVPVSDWSVNWAYPAGISRTSGWNATVTGTNPYTATSVGWNNTVQPGQTVEFGIQASKPAGSSVPVVEVSGTVCE